MESPQPPALCNWSARAARSEQYLACDPTGCIGSQEYDRADNVFWLPEPTQRSARNELSDHSAVENTDCVRAFCFRRTRTDNVYADAARPQFLGEHARQGDQCCFGD